MILSLSIEGPFDVSYFGKLGEINNAKSFIRNKENIQRHSFPGVYFWGFKNNENFIPYYVGKKTDSISKRFCEHIDGIIKPASCYKRPTEDYLFGLNGIEPYWKDPSLPLLFGNDGKNDLPKWFANDFEHFDNRFEYINNKEFLERRSSQPIQEADDYPISLLPNSRDPLKMYINVMQVCFIPLRDESFYQNYELKDLTGMLETYVKFSLRGKTMGDSYRLKTLNDKINAKNIQFEIDPVNTRQLFKHEPSESFIGYEF